MIAILLAAAIQSVTPSMADLINPGEGLVTPETAEMEGFFPGFADRDIYLLGPGDIISTVVEGGSSESLIAAGVTPWAFYTVSGDGYLSVSGIGAACIGDLTMNQAQEVFQQKVSRYYPSLRVTLSLAQPRTVRMDVRGMVEEPGTYLMSALSRVSDLVSMAGGIASYGSRFGTMITAGRDTIPVDLHIDPFTGGFVADPYLDRGTAVIFGECMSPVFVVGYDLAESWDCRNGETVRSLLEGMGGVRGNIDLSASRLVSAGLRSPIWDETAGILELPLAPGDSLLMVSSGMPVYVGGAVNVPGPLEYIPENTVLDYIILAGGADVNASLGRTVLYREGERLGSGDDILGTRPNAGDAIEVPYTWISRNSDFLSLLISVSSVGITLWAITK